MMLAHSKFAVTDQSALDVLLAEFALRVAMAREIEEVVEREGVGGRAREQALRSAWAACDALAEAVAAVRPSTMDVVRAKAAAFLWLDGHVPVAGDETRARLVADVMTFLAGESSDPREDR